MYPRRGGCPGAERVIPADQVAELHTWLRSERVAKDLARVTAERTVVFHDELAAEGRRYLSDWESKPNVLGAAVANQFVRQSRRGAEYAVDAWVSRFGTAFAARVVGELSRLVADASLWVEKPGATERFERLRRKEDLQGLYRPARVLRPYLVAGLALRPGSRRRAPGLDRRPDGGDRLQPGYHWQEPDQQAKKLTEVRVWTTTPCPNGSAPADRTRAEDPATFADLNPIAASEVLRDLNFLTN